MPRVSDVPAEVAANGSESRIVGRYQRASEQTQRLLAQLYLEGAAWVHAESTGDFGSVFRALLGETAPLSASSITRLKGEWQGEFESWRARRLDGHRYLYLWVDGVYFNAGQEEEKMALLCVLGLNEQGNAAGVQPKELLTMVPGYRESMESWAGVLRDLQDRGLKRSMQRQLRWRVIGDGALGIWAALGEVWPKTRSQRCWNHRTLNVLDKLPKRLWGQVRQDLRQATTAATRSACQECLEQIAASLR